MNMKYTKTRRKCHTDPRFGFFHEVLDPVTVLSKDHSLEVLEREALSSPS